jgi:putative chitinase
MITSERLCELAQSKETVLIASIAVPLDLSLATESKLRVAHFIAQVCYESGNFTRLWENLHYTHVAAIAAAWPRLAGRAQDLTSNPVALADAAYALELGNGDEASGDGFRFRGRGLIQLTGRANYEAAQRATGIPLLTDPDLAATSSNAVELARWFWQLRNCNVPADADDVRGVTELINGPALRGLDIRSELTQRAKTIFV